MTPNAITDARHRAGGFTLLEVLIAFLIASLGLGALIAGVSTALQASRTAARYEEATVRAQSRLEETVHGGRLMPGHWEGDDGGGYRWRVQIAPAPGVAPLAGDPSGAEPMLYAVSVAITWKDGPRAREVRLDTEHIGTVFRAP